MNGIFPIFPKMRQKAHLFGQERHPRRHGAAAESAAPALAGDFGSAGLGGAAPHTRARIGDVGQLKQPLQGAVLAVHAVHGDRRHIDGDREEQENQFEVAQPSRHTQSEPDR